MPNFAQHSTLRLLPSLGALGDAAAANSVNAGGSATGSFGADAYYSGGNTYSTTNAIDMSSITNAAVPQEVFQSERYGDLTYTIPNLTPGSAQTVTLYFAEIYETAAGKRIFDVAINGATVLSAFDIFAVAGGANKAIALEFAATADANGQIVIRFIPNGSTNPKINGISVAAAKSAFSLWYVAIFAVVIVAGVVGWRLYASRKRHAPLLSGAAWRSHRHRALRRG